MEMDELLKRLTKAETKRKETSTKTSSKLTEKDLTRLFDLATEIASHMVCAEKHQDEAKKLHAEAMEIFERAKGEPHD